MDSSIDKDRYKTKLCVDDVAPSRHGDDHAPEPLVNEDGDIEYFVEAIVGSRRRRRKLQYLVRWRGYGPDHDEWLPSREVKDTVALDAWLSKRRAERIRGRRLKRSAVVSGHHIW